MVSTVNAHLLRRLSLAASISLLMSASPRAVAQFDDFNDGDDAGWVRFSPLDVVGASSIFTFPDIGGDHGYRLQSPAPAVPAAGPARTFTYREDVYSDFYAAVDVVDWDNEVNQAFGLLFRATNIGLGETLGYVLNYDPQQASGGRGQIQFNIVTNEADQGTIGAANISFEPGRKYRIVMRAEGTRFSADVYDLNNLTSPLTSYWGTDDLYASGSVGLFNFYRGGDATNPEAGIADTTFDNYVAQAENDLVPAPGAWRGIDGWPHVLSLVPLNRTAYHPADQGIQFTVSTLGDQAVEPANVRLTLNGSDATGQLEIQPDGPALNVRLATLTANRVYDARLEIARGAEEPAAVTEWTFDTFSQDYLESAEVEIIELEDYNFDGGQFIDNPPVSGFRENGGGVNANTGYVDREGVPGVDFFDYETTPAAEEKAIYRPFDPVATQAGASETGSAQQFSGPDPAVNDTIRSRYADVDLQEFQITNTEGGEWLNYTREFPAKDYHVYLRGAGRATQEIHLDEVTSDPTAEDQSTERLGTFLLPNMGMEFNYRFVQLMTPEGSPAVVSLEGTKTVRLTIGSEQVNRVNETTALNYLAFVPAPAEPNVPLLVETASDVAGPYEAAPVATIIETSVTLPIDGDRAFFKLTSTGAPIEVVGIEVVNGSLVVRFQQP